MTFSLTILSLLTLAPMIIGITMFILIKFNLMTLSTTLSIAIFIAMLSVVMLSDVMLSVLC